MSVIRRKFTNEQKLEIVNQSMAEDISIESLAEKYTNHPRYLVTADAARRSNTPDESATSIL
jgi:transposase-like protein